MNRMVYGALGVAGVVLAILEFTVGNRPENGYSILLITSMVVCGTYLFSEYRFYSRHRALLASFQFIALPLLVILLGNIIAPYGWGPNWIELQLFDIPFDFNASFVSFLLIIPMYIATQLFNRYYDGRYPGFVFNRKQFGPKKFPILIHLTFMLIAFVTAYLLELMDFVVFGYVLLSVVQITQKLIVPAFKRERTRRWEPDRRSFFNSIGNGRRSSRSSSRPSSRSSANTSAMSSGNSGSSSRPSRRSSRNVSTSPSNGYREVPVRSRSAGGRSVSSSTSRRDPPAHRSPPRNVAEVDRGIEMVEPTKTRKVNSSKIKNYLPKGNFDHTDLKCMVCYEQFNQNSSQNIVVCPQCKFPAHEVEFKSWLNASSLCPRCNKEVNKSKLKSGTVSEAQYAKFIKKL